MSQNKIKTRAANKAYLKNWDDIFSKNNITPEVHASLIDVVSVVPKVIEKLNPQNSTLRKKTKK